MSKEFFQKPIPDEVLNWWEELQENLFQGNVASGFWDDSENSLIIPTKLALIHSEVSEAMEGHRKNRMDDHLPDHEQLDVELADAMVRIIDVAGYRGVNILRIIMEKVLYNHERADHKRNNRMTTKHGKRY